LRSRGWLRERVSWEVEVDWGKERDQKKARRGERLKMNWRSERERSKEIVNWGWEMKKERRRGKTQTREETLDLAWKGATTLIKRIRGPNLKITIGRI